LPYLFLLDYLSLPRIHEKTSLRQQPTRAWPDFGLYLVCATRKATYGSPLPSACVGSIHPPSYSFTHYPSPLLKVASVENFLRLQHADLASIQGFWCTTVMPILTYPPCNMVSTIAILKLSLRRTHFNW